MGENFIFSFMSDTFCSAVGALLAAAVMTGFNLNSQLESRPVLSSGDELALVFCLHQHLIDIQITCNLKHLHHNSCSRVLLPDEMK
jgi:hypothetical protein